MEVPGQAPQRATTPPFALTVSEQDLNDLPWYLEDYLQCPHDPAPKIAARIEQRVAQIGAELFREYSAATMMRVACGPSCATGWLKPSTST